MKTFEDKTIEKAVEKASKELNIPVEEVHYIIKEEKTGGVLGIGKTATIDVYTLEDVYQFGAEFLKNAIKSIGIDIETTSQISPEGVIRITINSARNPILIGRGGRTLRALNDLVRLAISNHFKRRYRVLLDVGDYKDKKYSSIISIARRSANEVARQHIDVKLDAMTSDERRIVHQILSEDPRLREVVTTESIGNGEKRAVVIKYNGKEEHAFQKEAVYYKDLVGNRHNKRGNRNNKRPQEIKNNASSLQNLLHNSDSNFLKEKVEEKIEKIREENKSNNVDSSINDLPSASITSPIIDTSKLKDLEDTSVDNIDKKADENK